MNAEAGQDWGKDDFDRLAMLALGGRLAPEELARLDAMAAADPARLRRAQELAELWTLTAAARGSSRQTDAAGLTRRALIPAAGVTAAAGVAGVLTWNSLRVAERTYEAPPGGLLRATLDDGTTVVLSRGSVIAVRMEPARRSVRMIRGAALWAVAKDRTRPFQIAVATHRLTVLGTRFNVEPDASGLRVDLLEGSLRVEGPGAAATLKPGQRYWAGHSPLVAPAEVADMAAWTEGRLVFDDAPLAEVSRRIHLFTGRGLAFADPGLARLRFSGVLDADDAQSWRLGLEAVLPVRVQVRTNGLRLTRRPAV